MEKGKRRTQYHRRNGEEQGYLTQTQVARRLGLSRACVQKIEERALQKLRDELAKRRIHGSHEL